VPIHPLPTVGPYGQFHRNDDGTCRVSLTAEGSAFVAGWMEAHPQMRAFAYAVKGPLVEQLERRGVPSDELECLCREAVVRAAIWYRPDRGAGFPFAIGLFLSKVLVARIRQEARHDREKHVGDKFLPSGIHADADDGPNEWAEAMYTDP